MTTTAAPPTVQGVVPLDERGTRRQRIGALAICVIPLLGLVAAIVLLWGRGVGILELALFAGFYVVTGFGITVGYHRLLTHRSFDASPAVRAAFAVAGTMAIQGQVIEWVADHRRHHAYSDREGDPHSPHLEDGVLRGLWHAHMGWLFNAETTSLERWAPDLLKERSMRILHRGFGWLVLVSLALPALIGYAFTGTLFGAFTGFVWGGLVRLFVLNHVTFSINSICHFYGRRPYETPDHSTNNWPLSVISFGESWHNNHHAFPTSAVHGLERWQVDPGAWLIAGLARLGLARNLKLPTDKQIARRS